MRSRCLNSNFVYRRKNSKKLSSSVANETDDEVYKQSLMLRRLAKKITGSPFIRLDS